MVIQCSCKKQSFSVHKNINILSGSNQEVTLELFTCQCANNRVALQVTLELLILLECFPKLSLKRHFVLYFLQEHQQKRTKMTEQCWHIYVTVCPPCWKFVTLSGLVWNRHCIDKKLECIEDGLSWDIKEKIQLSDRNVKYAVRKCARTLWQLLYRNDKQNYKQMADVFEGYVRL